jgi:TfoX/Sxy family transcriptional regulator of competence genes
MPAGPLDSAASPADGENGLVSYDEVLADRVRAALGHAGRVVEKRMFGGIAFMVQGKMCVSVGKQRLMCRIDPAAHDAALRRPGCRTVTMRGREFRGYVLVDAAALRKERDLGYWVGLALAFNKKARSSAKKQTR